MTIINNLLWHVYNREVVTVSLCRAIFSLVSVLKYAMVWHESQNMSMICNLQPFDCAGLMIFSLVQMEFARLMTIDSDMLMIGKLQLFVCVGLKFFVFYNLYVRDITSFMACLAGYRGWLKNGSFAL